MSVKNTLIVLVTHLVLFGAQASLSQDVQQSRQPGMGQSLRLSNTSTRSGKQYKWTLYVDADKSTLEKISYVEYQLHPAFDLPDRRVDGPRVGPRAFSTSDIALRPTEITTVIHYRNGDKQYLDYTLRLRSSFTNTWYVVVGYFGAKELDQAQSLANGYQQKGFKAAAVDTNSGEFPNFDRGVVMVVIGPSSKVQANSLLKKIPVLGGKPYIQQAVKA